MSETSISINLNVLLKKFVLHNTTIIHKNSIKNFNIRSILAYLDNLEVFIGIIVSLCSDVIIEQHLVFIRCDALGQMLNYRLHQVVLSVTVSRYIAFSIIKNCYSPHLQIIGKYSHYYKIQLFQQL